MKNKVNQWKNTDWSKSNDELARFYNITRNYVQTLRHRYGHPGARSPHRKGGGAKQRQAAKIAAKLSERKTVHQWLNDAGIPSCEEGKPLCLLRRIRIALDRLIALTPIEADDAQAVVALIALRTGLRNIST